MRRRLALLVAALWAVPAAPAAAQDPAKTVDPKALCGLLAAERGEPFESGGDVGELLGDLPGARCTVTIRDVTNSKVALSLIGLPRESGDACRVQNEVSRRLRGEGMTLRPITLRYGISSALWVQLPTEDSMLPLGVAALMACDEDFLVLGTVGAKATRYADLEDEIGLLEDRVNRTLSNLSMTYSRSPTLASSEADFVGDLWGADEDFYARFSSNGKNCLLEIGERYCGGVEADRSFNRLAAKHGEEPLARILALAEWRYPSGELVAPSIGPTLPVIQRLYEKSRTDPAAGVAMTRFVAMMLRMDTATGSSVPPPVP